MLLLILLDNGMGFFNEGILMLLVQSLFQQLCMLGRCNPPTKGKDKFPTKPASKDNASKGKEREDKRKGRETSLPVIETGKR